MAIVYFDGSAFVKLLVEEDGSDLAADLWDACDAPLSARLACPEVRAALAAAGRAGRLDAAERVRAEASWEEVWRTVYAVELSEPIATHAGQLSSDLALRGADAVHLASLLAIGSADTIFAVWDQRLRNAAHAAGVRLAPRISKDQ